METSLLDRLSALPSAQFNRIVLELAVAPGVLSAESAPQLQRAVELVRYFQQPGHDTAVIEAALAHLELQRAPSHFVELYRLRLGSKFSRWGPGGFATAANPRPLEAPFDRMYQPLRLRRRPTGDGINDAGTNTVVVMDARKLLVELRHLAIAGAPGSGKTTWMRATYRALIGHDDALPLFVTLRDLARLWTKAPREERSFEVFLNAFITEHVPEADLGGLMAVFASDAGPRPVLLVDGWDELGPLGSEVHEKLLGFLARYPRVLAVVTSRPFGISVPANNDGFTTLEIEPLASQEIHAIAQRFFTFSVPANDAQKAEQLADFLRAINSSPAAYELAQSPLLLIMMLVVSRSRRLPEKRHLLYLACVDSLLATIPDEKEEEGALLPRPQYRPDDAEERLRLTATLAAGTSSVPSSSEELAALLPMDWPAVVPPRQTRRGMRSGFIQWLAGTAGLLTVHLDSTIAFAHRSLQEFLAAWHHNATHQGDDELAREFLSRTLDRQSWEMLRLWAALAAERNRPQLNPVIAALLNRDDSGRLLAGLLLADGFGLESAVTAWLSWFVDRLAKAWTDDWLVCLDGWRAAPQQSRLESLAKALWGRSNRASFPEWLRLSFACVRLHIQQCAPQKDSLAAAAVRWLQSTPDDSCAIAAGRVFCGTFPVWPNDPPELGLLQLWPNARRLFGTRLQLAILCGAGPDAVRRLARARWPGVVQSPPLDVERARSLIAKCAVFDWALNIDDPQLAEFADTWITEAFRALSAELQIEGVYGYLEGWLMQQGRDWLRHFGTFGYSVPTDEERTEFLQRHQAPSHIPHAHDQMSALSWMQSLVRRVRSDQHEALARLWGDVESASWMRDFVDLDVGSVDRFGVVPVVAVRGRETPPVGLLACACRFALVNAVDPDLSHERLAVLASESEVRPTRSAEAAFQAALQEYVGDPMWPALARQLCSCATEDDRRLLTELAMNADCKPPLSWGLRYIVRGDLVFADGTELSLDQLADDLGLPRLPLLEPFPASAGALDRATALLTQVMLAVRRKQPKQMYAFNDEFFFSIPDK